MALQLLPEGLDWQFAQGQAGNPLYTHLAQMYAPRPQAATSRTATPTSPFDQGDVWANPGGTDPGVGVQGWDPGVPTGTPGVQPRTSPPAGQLGVTPQKGIQFPTSAQPGQTTPFSTASQTSDSGIYGAIPGFNDFIYSLITPYLQATLSRGDATSQALQAYLQQNFPQYMPQITEMLGKQQGAATNLLQGIAPYMTGVQGNLLGGQGPGTYGLNELLSQIMQQGLPGQRAVEGTTTQQLGRGGQLQDFSGNLMQSLGQGGTVQSPQQQQLLQTLMGFTQGGGLTPDYVNAMRSLVLDPSREALQGNLNRMAGGTASLTSPAFQEILRRQEEGFNNQLISQGFNNLQGFMGQAGQQASQGFGQGFNLAQLGTQAGQGATGQGLQAFGAVPQAAYPFANLAGSLGTNLLGQNLQAIGQGQQGLAQGIQGAGNIQGDFMSALAQYLQGQQGTGLGMNANILDQLRILANMYTGQQTADQASDAARWTATGNLLGKTPDIVKALKDIDWGSIFGRGTVSDTNPAG